MIPSHRTAVALALAALVAGLGCQSEGTSSPAPTTSATAASAAPSASASAAPSPSASAAQLDEPSDAGAPSDSIKDAAPPGMPGDAAAPSKLVEKEHDAGAPKHDAGAKPAAATAAPTATAAPSASEAALPAPEPGSADDVAAKIDAIFANVKVFQTHFKQDYRIKITGQTKTSTGTLVVDRPSKISFRYDPPNKNRVVSDGSLLKVYVADDAQMFVSPAANTEYPGALAFLMGHGLRPSFTFTINDKIHFDAGPVLVGKPRQPNPSYESVLFYVSRDLLEKKDPGVIQKVLVLDAQGNRNTFTFEQATTPSSVEPAEFVFEPPAGTTITKN